MRVCLFIAASLLPQSRELRLLLPFPFSCSLHGHEVLQIKQPGCKLTMQTRLQVLCLLWDESLDLSNLFLVQRMESRESKGLTLDSTVSLAETYST